MPNKGKFIGSQDNLFVPDAPTIGAVSGAVSGEASVAFTAPSDVGNDAITLYGASVFLAEATINYKVSVGTGTLSTGGSGNVYFIDGTPTKTLSLIKGFTYVFDLSDSSNSGHPFGFKNASDGAYTTGVTTSGTAGSASATVTLVLATDASEPSRYYCTSHGNGMGNTISLIEASASTDPLGAAQAGATGSSSPITVTGLTNGTSYIAQVWAINDYGNGPLSAATSSFSPVSPTVGLIAGGSASGGNVNVIQKIVPESAGNATDFGDLSATKANLTASGNDTRFIAVGGGTGGSTRIDVIEFVNYATTGNVTDFGNMTESRDRVTCASNNVRLMNIGGDKTGSGGRTDTADFVTIQSAGNAIDFGNLTATTKEANNGNVASSTRAIIAGGATSSAQVNTIEYFTIVSVGNATDFGDLTNTRRLTGGTSSNTRGVVVGGWDGSDHSNVMDYITIASTGNAQDFGDLTNAPYGTTALANSTKGIVSGGNAGSAVNVIQSFTIATTGNATDFGDLLDTNKDLSSAGSGHAGVQPEYAYSSLASAGNIGVMVVNGTLFGIDINTTGNTGMFGDATMGTGDEYGRMGASLGGNSVRGIIYGGEAYDGGDADSTNIAYFNFHSSGKITDFGDATVAHLHGDNVNNDTRLVAAHGQGGGANASNGMDYITIASTGNATDFGDTTVARRYLRGSQNSTRGIFASGQDVNQNYTNVMDYITIASAGNATDFGDMSASKAATAGVDSTTRSVFGGGFTGGTKYNVIEYVTIASTGNVTDFGDLTVARTPGHGGMSNQTRGVFSAGNSSTVITLDYITIASTGDATDFGDLTMTYASYGGGKGNGHGGIDRSTAFASLPAAIGLFNIRSTISFIDISTTGNSAQFGRLNVGTSGIVNYTSFASSSTRAVSSGGNDNTNTNAYSEEMYLITYASKGQGTDFGDATAEHKIGSGVSNGTRGVFFHGDNNTGYVNVIDYITIASIGNATDFGDQTVARAYATSAQSSTRGLFVGGWDGSSKDEIDYITIASAGNATDFGNLSQARYWAGGVDSSTRAVFGGGYASSNVNTIDYVTTASTGNATDFGDLTTSRYCAFDAFSNKTRGVFSAMSTSDVTMDYVTIASTGNAQDFGDVVGHATIIAGGGTSNSHGGIA